jgi:hypothetical protein
MGSLFVASYDSQGYGGVIRPRLHTVDEPFFSALPFIYSSDINGKCLLLDLIHGKFCWMLVYMESFVPIGL